MKIKKLVSCRRLAALATTALVGVGCAIPAAHAEITVYSGNNLVPSINFYVRIDAGLRMSTNVDLAQYNGKVGKSTIVQAGGNDWGTSMFGIDGALKLNQDLQAVYKIESGFNAMNGNFNSSTNSVFNRRAYVGLSDDRFGTIMVGRDLFINNDIWGYDPMLQENTSTATLVYGRNWPGAKDMVEYRSPDLHGLKVGLQAAFDNGDGDTMTTHLTNKYGATAQYTIGQFNALAAYDEIRSNHGYVNLYSASKEAIFAATYNFDPVEVFAGYEMLRAPQAGPGEPNAIAVNSTDNTGATNQVYPSAYASRASLYWMGAVWTVSPNVKIRGAWYHTGINDGVGHANLFTAGTEYYFRPNMFWYATVGEVVNHGKAEFAADIGAPPPAPGHNQFAGYSGLSIGF